MFLQLKYVIIKLAESKINSYPLYKNYTVVNGHASGTVTDKNANIEQIDDRSIESILCIYKEKEMSRLTASGVESAECKKTKNGYKITIKLKPETVHSLSEKPASHYASMEVINFDDEDIGGFEIKNCDVKYPGGTITALINDSNGMLISYSANNPISISGELSYGIINAYTEVSAVWRSDILFKYK